MQARPLQRIILYLLPALLLLNIVLFVWFCRKTRETSTDEVVQKAYIVSRMLSEVSASFLVRGDFAGLERISEEAFKDRHIVAVAVLDPKEKVIFQSTVPRTYDRLSTFRTPVKLGEKNLATLVTSFSLDESAGMINGRLRRTAAIQFGMLALVAAALAWLCRRERLAYCAAAGRHTADVLFAGGKVAAVPPEEPAAGAVLVVSSAIPDWTGDLSAASSRLERAAQLLAGEADRQLGSVVRARKCLDRIDCWHRQALHDGGNAEDLIAAGRKIIAMVQERTGDELSSSPVGATREWEELLASVDRLAGVLQDGQGGSVSSLSPDERVIAAAELAREGIDTIRQRVFPALATVAGEGETVAVRLTALLEKVAEAGDRSAGLTGCSAELFDLADGIRLLRCEVIPVAGGDREEAEMRLNLLADRMESLAGRLKRESQALLGTANEATAASRSLLTAVEGARETLLAAGSSVEDAAAAAVMGNDHLYAFLRQAGIGVIKI